MKLMFKTGLPLIAIFLLSGCFRNDLRTETFKIQQLRSEESAKLIAQALRPVVGIKEIRPNFETRELTVVFEGLESYKKNIEYAVVKAGFDLPNWPADPADKAKLPENLR